MGSTITGKLLDPEYRVVKEALKQNDAEGSKADFPIEYARLPMMPVHLLVFCASVFAWGWCLKKSVSIAAPLVFQVLRKSNSEKIQELIVNIVPVGHPFRQILSDIRWQLYSYL